MLCLTLIKDTEPLNSIRYKERFKSSQRLQKCIRNVEVVILYRGSPSKHRHSEGDPIEVRKRVLVRGVNTVF